jgi:hypothetical protein
VTATPPAEQLTEAERVRLLAALTYVHAHTCPSRTEHSALTCPARPGTRPLAAALAHLDEHPRDARGTRRIFHDAVCRSQCGPDSDHADCTQATTVAALRRFRASEASR